MFANLEKRVAVLCTGQAEFLSWCREQPITTPNYGKLGNLVYFDSGNKVYYRVDSMAMLKTIRYGEFIEIGGFSVHPDADKMREWVNHYKGAIWKK